MRCGEQHRIVTYELLTLGVCDLSTIGSPPRWSSAVGPTISQRVRDGNYTLFRVVSHSPFPRAPVPDCPALSCRAPLVITERVLGDEPQFLSLLHT